MAVHFDPCVQMPSALDQAMPSARDQASTRPRADLTIISLLILCEFCFPRSFVQLRVVRENLHEEYMLVRLNPP